MDDLRDHLFATMEGLRDQENPIDVERAKAVCEVAGKIIDSAKTEVELLKTVGGEPGSNLFKRHKLPPPGSGLKAIEGGKG